MSDNDNNDNNQDQKPNLSLIMSERGSMGIEKQQVIKAIRAMSDNPKWHLLQEICHEILATYIVDDPNKLPSVQKLHEHLTTEIEERYAGEPEKLNLLRKGLPSLEALRKWTKLEGWNDAIWAKARVGSLFSPQRRAAMINAIYVRGLTKSDNAAKLFLQMSGDFSEKGDGEKDRVADTFREINKLLHNKKNA
mgnify:CR=1 FL=1